MSEGIRFCLTALGSLDDLNVAPPVTPAELLSFVDGCPSAIDRVSTIFLFDDLSQRQSFLSGELSADDIDPVILTAEQVRNEEPLPDTIADADGASEDVASVASQIDGTWERYFRYAVERATFLGSGFLRDWVGFEVALRNALTIERAKALGVDASMYLVAADMEGAEDCVATMVSEWHGASTPLAGEQALIAGRFQWAQLNDRWFSFDADELSAYAVKLMLLKQWQRIVKK